MNKANQASITLYNIKQGDGMLDLKASENNFIEINHGPSNTLIGLYYNNPKSRTKIKYRSEIIKTIVQDQDYDAAFDIKCKYFKEHVTGFREGDLGFDGKPLSLEEDNENYRSDWFELLKEYYSEIIEAFCLEIMGESSYVVKGKKRPFLKN